MPNVQEANTARSFPCSQFDSTVSPVTRSMPPITVRPFSTGSSMSGINGGPLSPGHSSLATTCHTPPSPPPGGAAGGSGGGPSMAQQLPPACGARQLSKLKRFLTTLQQFGLDISPEIGEHVRGLVLALVNSHLSVEEFHAKLQQSTNFPLRPFVIPFLKANLPLLQRELLHCAHLAKQSPHQYLLHNERFVFESSGSSGLHPPAEAGRNSLEIGGRNSPVSGHDLSERAPPGVTAVTSGADKRKASPEGDERAINRFTQPDTPSLPSKRPRTSSPPSSLRPPRYASPSHRQASPPRSPLHPRRQGQGSPPQGPVAASGRGGFQVSSSEPCRFEDLVLMQDLRAINRVDREDVESAESSNRSTANSIGDQSFSPRVDQMMEDLKRVENMLGCVVSMVDKCQSAVVALRTQWQAHGGDQLSVLEAGPRSLRLPAVDEHGALTGTNIPAAAAGQVIQQRALTGGVQRAALKAEQLTSAERTKMDAAITEARRQAMDEVLLSLNCQEESTETCWNCGRLASETCSGCNVARYCGAFCQHKDWEHHHRLCNQSGSSRTGRLPGPQRGGVRALISGGGGGTPPLGVNSSVVAERNETASVVSGESVSINGMKQENPA